MNVRRVEVIIKEEAVKDDCYDRIEYDVYGNPYKLTITNGKEFESKSEPCKDAVSREDIEECKELMTDVNGDTVYAVRIVGY